MQADLQTIKTLLWQEFLKLLLQNCRHIILRTLHKVSLQLNVLERQVHIRFEMGVSNHFLNTFLLLLVLRHIRFSATFRKRERNGKKLPNIGIFLLGLVRCLLDYLCSVCNYYVRDA